MDRISLRKHCKKYWEISQIKLDSPLS